MRLIEESAYDPATKSRLALACETTLRIVVRDRPRQAWNARLLEEIQRAVLIAPPPASGISRDWFRTPRRMRKTSSLLSASRLPRSRSGVRDPHGVRLAAGLALALRAGSRKPYPYDLRGSFARGKGSLLLHAAEAQYGCAPCPCHHQHVLRVASRSLRNSPLLAFRMTTRPPRFSSQPAVSDFTRS